MIGLEWSVSKQRFYIFQTYIYIYIAGFHASGQLFQYFISAPVLILIFKETFCTFANRYIKQLKKIFWVVWYENENTFILMQ